MKVRARARGRVRVRVRVHAQTWGRAVPPWAEWGAYGRQLSGAAAAAHQPAVVGPAVGRELGEEVALRGEVLGRDVLGGERGRLRAEVLVEEVERRLVVAVIAVLEEVVEPHLQRAHVEGGLAEAPKQRVVRPGLGGGPARGEAGEDHGHARLLEARRELGHAQRRGVDALDVLELRPAARDGGRAAEPRGEERVREEPAAHGRTRAAARPAGRLLQVGLQPATRVAQRRALRQLLDHARAPQLLAGAEDAQPARDHAAPRERHGAAVVCDHDDGFIGQRRERAKRVAKVLCRSVQEEELAERRHTEGVGLHDHVLILGDEPAAARAHTHSEDGLQRG